MFGDMSGPTLLIIIALAFPILAAAITFVIVLAVKKRKPSAGRAKQQAYEAGVRQAELQRAYEAGLNANRADNPAKSSDRP